MFGIRRIRKEKRWYRGSWRFELGRVHGLYWAELAFGGHSEGIQVSAGLGRLGGFWLTYQSGRRVDAWLMRLRLLPWRWSTITARDTGERFKVPTGAEWGIALHTSLGSWGVLKFGHDEDNGYHFRRGLCANLRANRELTFWRGTWITGRDKVTRTDGAAAETTIDVGRYAGDVHPVLYSRSSMTWRNRFRTKTHEYWNFEFPKGIPQPYHDDCAFDDGGDNALMDCSRAATMRLEDALADIAADVRKETERNGGKAWKPREVPA